MVGRGTEPCPVSGAGPLLHGHRCRAIPTSTFLRLSSRAVSSFPATKCTARFLPRWTCKGEKKETMRKEEKSVGERKEVHCVSCVFLVATKGQPDVDISRGKGHRHRLCPGSQVVRAHHITVQLTTVAQPRVPRHGSFLECRSRFRCCSCKRERKGKGREGKGREGKGREGKGREGNEFSFSSSNDRTSKTKKGNRNEKERARESNRRAEEDANRTGDSRLKK